MKGEVVYLYAFDVANEIILSRIQEALSSRPVPYEVRVDRTFPKDVPLYKPLAIEPPSPGKLAGSAVRLLVRIYEVGVVSVCMRTPFEAAGLHELMPFHSPVLEDGRPLDQLARRLCDEVRTNLKDALVRPVPPSEPEAYTVFCITELAGVEDVSAWLAGERRAVAGLLSETEASRLSDAQVEDVMRLRRSFEKTDAVVIDWDAALLIDLTGYVDDVLYVLELANLQLEEFKLMDEVLDRQLNKAYDDLDKRHWSLLAVTPRVLRQLRRFRVDVTKLADEVTHITKFFGDWYLARVYLAARERFHLEHWRGSVERRLAQLDQLYSVVHGEINEKRMLWLEIAIVVLFIVDLLAIFLWK